MARKSFGERLKSLFSSAKWDEDMFDELEDLLLEGDLGAVTAMHVSDELRKKVKSEKPQERDDVMKILRDILADDIKITELEVEKDKMNVFLILGVNGVGKTTTLAKLAHHYNDVPGVKPVLSAGDTFRAAAIDQLQLHGERIGVRVVSQSPGSDPGAVIYDTLESAKARGENLVLADTAGRMHNKANLVKELQKIHKIVASKSDGGNYKKLLVIDATTGQNGLSQAATFQEAVGVDGIVLTKYDSAAKGGIAIRISRDLGIPFCFIGTGETYDSLIPFDKDYYLDTLLGL